MRLQHIRSIDELESLKETWTIFESLKGGPSLFQSWIWNRIWVETVLCPKKNSSLNVHVLEDGSGSILAILPFFDQKIVGSMIKLTQFLGHRMSYHNDILLSEPENAELAKEVVRVLIDDIGYNGVLHLRHLDGESQFTKQLLSEGLADYQCDRVYVQADPRITNQRERLGKSKKKTLRWAENYLHKHFKSKFRVISGLGFDKAFDELIDLHQRRFSSIERSTVLKGTNLTFLKAVTSKFSNLGKVEITQLVANGVTIAAMLMALDKNRYFFMQSGFNPEFTRYSPMRILITETMRRGFEDFKYEYFDLGPGYESYKYDWKPSVGTNYFCSIGGSGLYSKSLAALYGVAFRRQLPSSLK